MRQKKITDTKRVVEKEAKRKREPSLDSTSGYETHEEHLPKMSLFSENDLNVGGDLPLNDELSDQAKKDSLKLTDFDHVSDKKEDWASLSMLPMNSDDEDDKAEDNVKSGKDEGNGKTDKATYKDTDLDKLTKECTSLLEKELDSWKKSGTEGNADASKSQKLSSETKDENAK